MESEASRSAFGGLSFVCPLGFQGGMAGIKRLLTTPAIVILDTAMAFSDDHRTLALGITFFLLYLIQFTHHFSNTMLFRKMVLN